MGPSILPPKTNLDALEDEPEEAFRANSLGAWNVALAAREQGASLIHISTLGL
ncbi:MAG: sugar nucleotide-binding protein [Halioglobus sp.]|nr:sugar nucleotide-binding protein [Halioglobus sp.]